jgi:hypothetical protein
MMTTLQCKRERKGEGDKIVGESSATSYDVGGRRTGSVAGSLKSNRNIFISHYHKTKHY